MKCQRCGACCRTLLVECDYDDCVREPRLLKPSTNPHGLSLADLEGGEKCIKLWRCRFLGPDNLCTIYATRPQECRDFEPGNPKCLEAREECHTGDMP